MPADRLGYISTSGELDIDLHYLVLLTRTLPPLGFDDAPEPDFVRSSGVGEGVDKPGMQIGFVREAGTFVVLMFAMIVIASSATLVGRLLPWSRESPARQLVSALAMMVASGGVLYVGIQIGGVVASILGESFLTVPTIGLPLVAATGASSVAIEWLDS